MLCVLMLRGPQTVGELRGRTERMHEFDDMDEVEHVLESLAAREPDPLVAPAAADAGSFVERRMRSPLKRRPERQSPRHGRVWNSGSQRSGARSR